MIKKILVIFLLLLLLGWIFASKNTKDNSLIAPTASFSPSPAPRPKTFKFDSATDLKAELEKINPQVLESDFE